MEKRIKCCQNCEDRSVGCHSTCEKYKAERDAYHADKERETEGKNTESLYWDYYYGRKRR